MDKKFLGVLALFVAGLVLVSFASAFSGDSETKEELRNAIENRDYESFLQIHLDRVSEHFTEEKFNQIVERQAFRAEIQETIENNDYAAWVELMEQSSSPRAGALLSTLNEDNFSLLQELHDARQSQDFERAKEIKEELGLPGKDGMYKMHSRGMRGFR